MTERTSLLDSFHEVLSPRRISLNYETAVFITIFEVMDV